jgi:hypothetical protein
MKASHKDVKVIIGYKEVSLKSGDFVFGRLKAAKELKMSEQSIRTCLDFLKTSENLTIKVTNRYSIISIVNWDIYQQQEIENNHLNNQQVTNKQPTSNHKQECKELKNNKYSLDFLSFWKAYPKKSGSKKIAFDNWNKLNGEKPEIEIVLKAIQDQIIWRKEAGDKFRPEWKDPERWIKGKMWEAELGEKEKSSW